MVRICKVLLNNEVSTVVEFDGLNVQLPPMKESRETVKVQCIDGLFRVVSDDFVEVNKINHEPKAEKRIEIKKKTTKKSKKEQSKDIAEQKENA